MREIALKEIAKIDWGNTSLTKKSYVSNGDFLGVSAAGCDGRMDHAEHNVGTIVLSAIGANCGKMFFPEQPFTAIKNTITITPNDNADSKYLYYFLNNYQIESRGAGQPFITKNLTSNKIIPLPPLDQQKKIAAILDAADAYRQKTKALIKKYDELTQSLFLDMFGDFVLNPYGFVQSTLGELLPEKNSIKCGPFGSQLKIGEYIDEGIPVYGIDNVAVNRFKEAKPKFISETKFKQLGAFEVNYKDVLITRTGTVGRTCLAPDVDKAVIGPNLLKVRIQNNKLLPIFLSFAFNYSPSIVRQIEMFSPGATVAVYNTGNLKKLKILVPSIELQGQFVNRYKIIEAQKAQAQACLVQAENLFNSLLQKAFKGKLV